MERVFFYIIPTNKKFIIPPEPLQFCSISCMPLRLTCQWSFFTIRKLGESWFHWRFCSIPCMPLRLTCQWSFFTIRKPGESWFHWRFCLIPCMPLRLTCQWSFFTIRKPGESWFHWRFLKKLLPLLLNYCWHCLLSYVSQLILFNLF
jgi:hypothetical protein